MDYFEVITDASTGEKTIRPYTQEEIEAVEASKAAAIEAGRKDMKLSFSQFVVGLTEQGWITEVEAGAWLSANALPAAVEAAIATLPETAEDGSKPRLRARARALRPTEIERTNELLLMMAAMQGASAEQLDQFFRIYAGV